MSLIVVGTVAFDSIKTPVGQADRVVGGAASYIALAASHFVNNQELISVIGEDFPANFLEELCSRGVNQGGLKLVEGEKSFFWEGSYHDDLIGRDTLVTELNVLEGWTPEVPDEAKETDFVMLGNLDPSVQSSVLDQMTSTPRLVVLDTMNFWMDIAMDSLKAVIGRVNVLMINDDEARQLSGEESLTLAAEKIHMMGPEHRAALAYETFEKAHTTLGLPIPTDNTVTLFPTMMASVKEKKLQDDSKGPEEKASLDMWRFITAAFDYPTKIASRPHVMAGAAVDKVYV